MPICKSSRVKRKVNQMRKFVDSFAEESGIFLKMEDVTLYTCVPVNVAL